MSQKTIRKGDICRIRHNTSEHGFAENTLVVIKECRPKGRSSQIYLKPPLRPSGGGWI